MSLKDYVAALAAGTLVGVIYGLINVRSPRASDHRSRRLAWDSARRASGSPGQTTDSLVARHDLVAKGGVRAARAWETAGRAHLCTGIRAQGGGALRVTLQTALTRRLTCSRTHRGKGARSNASSAARSRIPTSRTSPAPVQIISTGATAIDIAADPCDEAAT